MSKIFHKKEAFKMLSTEDGFIRDMFKIMPLPMRTIAEENSPTQEESTEKSAKVFTLPNKQIKRANTFEELHTKLEGLKGFKKLDYRQKLIKKHLENKIKKKKKKEERWLQKKLKMEENAAGSSKIQIKNEDLPKVPKPKPVFNSEGKMVFSKFDFSEIGIKKKLPKNKNDPKKVLHQLQRKKEKLKQLEESGDKETAADMKEKDAWKSALARANGEKIKDDPELLKRSIKRQTQEKKQSAKKWNSRLEGVQKAMQGKQEKRQENIMKRKKDKKANKLKKAAKKGRIVSGFN